MPLSPIDTEAMARARALTATRASGKVTIPAPTAAAHSPRLCPITTSGLTPCLSSRRMMAMSLATIAGWQMVVSLSASSAACMAAASASFL